MKKQLVICDFCGCVQPDGLSWEFATVHVAVDVPRDGLNGGDYSGDMCRPCRDRLADFMEAMKTKQEPTP